jgi:predicted transposase YdaD
MMVAMSPLIQRHDQFFKRLLDQPGAAGALLRERLPPEVAALLDDGPPELMAGSFVPAELREYRTDRLYRARTTGGRPLLIHTVVEHKSAPDSRIGLQLLGYKTRILEAWDRAEGLPWPAVLSLVVYHGRAGWRVPLTLAGAVDADPVLRPWLVDFRYSLVDLGRLDDVGLSGNAVLRTGFLILKYGSGDADLRTTLLTLGRAALALGFDDLVALVRYVLGEPNEIEAGILREVLKEILPEQEERIMSIAAEQWKAEGFSQGVLHGEARGEARGKAEMLLRQLRRRFHTLAPEMEARVREADGSQLDDWSERFVDAQTLADVFTDPTH